MLVTNRSISQSHWENNRTGKRDQQFESPIPWQFQVTIVCTGCCLPLGVVEKSLGSRIIAEALIDDW
jgi:hypothetical protein